ncbi:MAG TPA: hypothetical protein DCF44_05785 [Chitinophagaceae bacterium]|nr:hypothetical protein [Chitinophagaceae bacterium]
MPNDFCNGLDSVKSSYDSKVAELYTQYKTNGFEIYSVETRLYNVIQNSLLWLNWLKEGGISFVWLKILKRKNRNEIGRGRSW